MLSFPFMLFVEFDKLQSVETTLMSHYWTLGVIYEQIFSQPFVLCDWMSLRLKRIDEEIASICLYSSFLCFLFRSICVTSYITMWKIPWSCTFEMFAKHSVHLSWSEILFSCNTVFIRLHLTDQYSPIKIKQKEWYICLIRYVKRAASIHRETTTFSVLRQRTCSTLIYWPPQYILPHH